MQIFISFIIALYLIWSLDLFVSSGVPYLLGNVKEFNVFLLWLSLLPLFIFFGVRRLQNKNQENFTHTDKFIILLFLAFSSFLVVLSLVYDQDMGERGPLAILAATFFATVGWIITSYINMGSTISQAKLNEGHHRRQHTFSALMNFRSSEIVRFHRKNIAKTAPPHTVFDCKYLIDNLIEDYYDKKSYEKDNIPALESIIYLCNFYEFIAAAVKKNDLDIELLELSFKGILIENIRKYGPIIKFLRKGIPGKFEASETRYGNYIWLIGKLGENPENFLIDICGTEICSDCKVKQADE